MTNHSVDYYHNLRRFGGILKRQSTTDEYFIEYGNYGHKELKNGHLVIEKDNGQNMADGFELSG